MGKFILRRFAVALLQLVGISMAVFFGIRFLPADPVARLVGMNATPEAYAQQARLLGLDKSIFIQFTDFLGLTASPGLLQGSLGKSWVTDEPVIREIAVSLPVTLQVVTLALAIAFAIALPLGLASARRPGGVADRVSLVWGLFAGAQPDYWWGLLFIFVFFFLLRLAPSPLGILDPIYFAPDPITGFILVDTLLRGQFDLFENAAAHFALPVLTMVFVISGAILKMVRTNTLRALRSDYVTYARASGLPERQVARYALRAALTPAITLVGIFYGVLLSAAVTIETVFSLNGIGSLAVRSILDVDYPAIQGVVITVAATSLMIYLALDIIHSQIDPRIGY
jgi:ABC-type dipeptide/oligopeptide/nickel transport system permease component